jgi:DNA segregation ATPase FtsK/SpoIIIE, S-DNA-T family
VSCPDLATLTGIPGGAIDLRRVWAGRTEYGQDWHLPLAGSASHTLTAGATGAGKNSVMWCPLVSIAPALRNGLVRVSGIDPKGMELAYGRRIFHRYAVTGTDTLAA